MIEAPSTQIGALAARVRLAIFDVDGVFTNGQLLLGPDGAEFKQFHVRDGHGLVMLRETKIELAVITGRQSAVVAQRMADLGIRHVFQGQRDKLAALAALQATLAITDGEICYVGDDLPDIPIMRRVALPIAVADAHPEVKAIARHETRLPGGGGAVREVCELIMGAQGTLAGQFARFGVGIG